MWLKPWLKLISFGSNFFHLAKMLATTNSEDSLICSLKNREDLDEIPQNAAFRSLHYLQSQKQSSEKYDFIWKL